MEGDPLAVDWGWYNELTVVAGVVIATAFCVAGLIWTLDSTPTHAVSVAREAYFWGLVWGFFAGVFPIICYKSFSKRCGETPVPCMIERTNADSISYQKRWFECAE